VVEFYGGVQIATGRFVLAELSIEEAAIAKKKGVFRIFLDASADDAKAGFVASVFELFRCPIEQSVKFHMIIL
jgi:hypothetical protein